MLVTRARAARAAPGPRSRWRRIPRPGRADGTARSNRAGAVRSPPSQLGPRETGAPRSVSDSDARVPRSHPCSWHSRAGSPTRAVRPRLTGCACPTQETCPAPKRERDRPGREPVTAELAGGGQPPRRYRRYVNGKPEAGRLRTARARSARPRNGEATLPSGQRRRGATAVAPWLTGLAGRAVRIWDNAGCPVHC
jgi:hypothetical protein